MITIQPLPDVHAYGVETEGIAESGSKRMAQSSNSSRSTIIGLAMGFSACITSFPPNNKEVQGVRYKVQGETTSTYALRRLITFKNYIAPLLHYSKPYYIEANFVPLVLCLFFTKINGNVRNYNLVVFRRFTTETQRSRRKTFNRRHTQTCADKILPPRH